MKELSISWPAQEKPMQKVAEHAQLEKNKDVIEHFFELANAGKAADLEAIVREDYVEHADSRDFRDGLARSIASNPSSPVTASYEEERQRIRGTIVRMIAERDHVWTFSAVEGPQARVARIDMFRLSDSQIAEHWAVVEQVPTERQHDNDPFAYGRGPQDYKTQPKRIATVTSAAQANLNRRLARDFYQYFLAQNIDGMDTIMDEGYIQHHPGHPDGRWPGMREEMIRVFAMMRNAFKEQAKAAGGPMPVKLPYGPVRILTEGDRVWIFVQNGQKPAQFNQFRIEAGRIAEHFGTYENFPPERLNNNHFHGYGRGPAADFSA